MNLGTCTNIIKNFKNRRLSLYTQWRPGKRYLLKEGKNSQCKRTNRIITEWNITYNTYDVTTVILKRQKDTSITQNKTVHRRHDYPIEPGQFQIKILSSSQQKWNLHVIGMGIGHWKWITNPTSHSGSVWPTKLVTTEGRDTLEVTDKRRHGVLQNGTNACRIISQSELSWGYV